MNALQILCFVLAAILIVGVFVFFIIPFLQILYYTIPVIQRQYALFRRSKDVLYRYRIRDNDDVFMIEVNHQTLKVAVYDRDHVLAREYKIFKLGTDDDGTNLKVYRDSACPTKLNITHRSIQDGQDEYLVASMRKSDLSVFGFQRQLNLTP